VFDYCIVVSVTAFSVICNKTFYKVYTLLSPHHTKSPLSSRGRDKHIIHTSALVTVFTVRVSEHNFIVLTYLLTYIRGPCAARTPPSRKIIVPEASALPHVFLISTF